MDLSLKAFKQVFSCGSLAVNKKAQRPLLLDVCIDNGWIASTDLRFYVRARLPGEWPFGKCLFVADSLAAVTKQKDGTVRISNSDHGVCVECGFARVVNDSLDVDDFPWPNMEAAEHVGTVAADDLLSGIEKAFRAAPKVEKFGIGWNLFSVLLNVTEHAISCVGTDGAHLIACTVMAQTPTAKERDLLIDAESVRLLVKFLKHIGGKVVNIFADERNVAFKTDDAEAVVVLMETRFPKWQSVFKQVNAEFEGLVKFDKATDVLKNLLKSVPTKKDRDTLIVHLEFDGESCARTTCQSNSLNMDWPFTVVSGKGKVKRRFVAYRLLNVLEGFPEGAPVKVIVGPKDEEVMMFSGNVKAVIMPVREEA